MDREQIKWESTTADDILNLLDNANNILERCKNKEIRIPDKEESKSNINRAMYKLKKVDINSIKGMITEADSRFNFAEKATANGQKEIAYTRGITQNDEIVNTNKSDKSAKLKEVNNGNNAKSISPVVHMSNRNKWSEEGDLYTRSSGVSETSSDGRKSDLESSSSKGSKNVENFVEDENISKLSLEDIEALNSLKREYDKCCEIFEEISKNMENLNKLNIQDSKIYDNIKAMWEELLKELNKFSEISAELFSHFRTAVFVSLSTVDVNNGKIDDVKSKTVTVDIEKFKELVFSNLKIDDDKISIQTTSSQQVEQTGTTTTKTTLNTTQQSFSKEQVISAIDESNKALNSMSEQINSVHTTTPDIENLKTEWTASKEKVSGILNNLKKSASEEVKK